MHSDWCEIGLDPGRFWELTPREIEREISAAVKRLHREHNDRMSMAWHTAVLTRMDAKKFPKLNKLQIKDKSSKPPDQSWEEQYALASAWANRKKH